MAKKQDSGFKVSIKPKLPGKDRIIVPHGGRELAIAYPIYGPNNALGIIKSIQDDTHKLVQANSSRRIRQATTAEVMAVVHPTYNGQFRNKAENRVSGEITDIINKRYFRGANAILYHPDTQLAYFIPYPKFNSRSIVETSDLVTRVKSGEVFETVPFSEIAQGVLSSSDLIDNLYVITWAGGKEGAEKLKDIARRTPAKEAYLWVPNVFDLKKPEGRIATLGVGDAGELYLGGSDGGDGSGGYAFGVLDETGETSPQNLGYNLDLNKD